MGEQKFRVERDSLGEVQVPAEQLWGAQTQRSKDNFRIGQEKMPREIIKAFAQVKKAAAEANFKLGVLEERKYQAIAEAADAILAGEIGYENFPLAVWQTGSGTQSNMNVNEVITNYINRKYDETILHPNDDVNRSQSSNDTFPTAMVLAAYTAINETLLPELDEFITTLQAKEDEFATIIKIGRTHLQDAVPLTVGNEISGWKQSLIFGRERIEQARDNALTHIALGGTAVGTGLNAPEGFDQMVAEILAEAYAADFQTARNKFTSLSSKSEFAYVHGAISSLAGDVLKIANDIRWLASGPRAGIGEYIIPSNEPGSSIMPGKVNPTQAEALTMVVAQVLGNETTIQFAASQGNFQLNVYLPVIAHNFLQSVNLLADGLASFRQKCLTGLTVNQAAMTDYLTNSLMLVTGLTPHIGYDKAAEIANKAHADGTSLKEACLALGYLSEAAFDQYLNPEELV